MRCVRPQTALVAAVVVASLLLLPGGAGQPPTFTEQHQVRIAPGDIPSTAEAEPAGSWNVQEVVHVDEPGLLSFRVPVGFIAAAQAITCDCEHTVEVGPDGSLLVQVDSAPAAIRFRYQAPLQLPLSLDIEVNAPVVVVLYAPAGTTVRASEPVGDPLPSSEENPGFDIYWFQGDLSSPLLLRVEPRIAASPEVPPSQSSQSSQSSQRVDLVAFGAGMVAGAAVWALLVHRGLVQPKRSPPAEAAGRPQFSPTEEGPSRPAAEATQGDALERP